jgi:hypothetical protein
VHEADRLVWKQSMRSILVLTILSSSRRCCCCGPAAAAAGSRRAWEAARRRPAAGSPRGVAVGTPCPVAGRLRCREEDPGSSWYVAVKARSSNSRPDDAVQAGKGGRRHG